MAKDANVSSSEGRLSFDSADAQADLSLRSAHMSEGIFSHIVALIIATITICITYGFSLYYYSNNLYESRIISQLLQ